MFVEMISLEATLLAIIVALGIVVFSIRQLNRVDDKEKGEVNEKG